MKLSSLLMLLTVCVVAAGCQSTKIKANKLPKGVAVNKSVEIPNQTQVAFYLPKSATEHRFYLEQWNVWVDPGQGVKDGVQNAIQAYFPSAEPLDLTSDQQIGLLIDIDPKWTFSNGKALMTINYRVFDGEQKEIRKGEKEYKASLGNVSDGTGFYNASLRATQLMLVDVLNKLKPTQEKYASTLKMQDANVKQLVNLEKPFSSGTGFYINGNGQLLTAAHVLNNCLVVQAKVGDEFIDVTPEAKSTLLDLAVINTDKPIDKFLPFRQDKNMYLGESVTNVGYPLQGLLAASPNLTRGNISSRSALKGSVGLFQFSAPIQPGSSGGPVVSDGGELLGITVSTLNSAKLIESGVLPQNVNFALEAKYAARFLDKHNVPHVLVEPNENGHISIANEAALSSVVQLSCYQ
ncbi:MULTISPECIES: S1 family peptidase [Shewanella]|uniref:S1 family peptidase n=1 Tax=Shewanella TaxID=22 RepID=UPI0006D66819|nr:MULTISPECIES: serine protease [Shewanella]KPZ70094.1 Serine protease Do-like HtrA [Shewanella sp. P1-14-1]